MDGLESWARLIIAVGAAASVVFACLKWILPATRAIRADTVAIRDTLVGRDAVHDSITGTEISPQIPGIGARMAHQETQMGVLASAVSELAVSSRRLDDLEQRVTAIEQGHHLERMAGKVESIQLLKTIETVAHDDGRPDDN